MQLTGVIIANAMVQNLVQLLGESTPQGYTRRVEKIPQASSAFVM